MPDPSRVVRLESTTTMHEIVSWACRAPSVHNSQPWRWRVDGTTILLHADFSRSEHAEPRGRHLMISCGAALHHAQVAARALGWHADVERLPDPGRPDTLARLTLAPARRTASDEAALEHLARRRTDPRRFTSWPVDAGRLAMLVGAGAAWGATPVVIDDLVPRARVGHLLGQAHLGQASNQPVVEGSDDLVVLTTPGDGVLDCLRAGEALSALWLTAVREELSVVPLSPVTATDAAREALRQALGVRATAVPQLLLRVGWQPIGRAGLPPSPRLALADVLAD